MILGSDMILGSEPGRSSLPQLPGNTVSPVNASTGVLSLLKCTKRLAFGVQGFELVVSRVGSPVEACSPVVSVLMCVCVCVCV
jgi:hypothetical protein